MRVSRVDVYAVPARWRQFVFVEVRTDDGLCGTGEATMAGQAAPVIAAVLQMAQDLVGQDSRQIARHAHRWLAGTYWRGGSVLTTAASGLEIALWDLCGQRAGLPVHQFFGGAVRDAIPVYANGWFQQGPDQDDASAPELLHALAARVGAQGFTALKLYPLGYAEPGRRVGADAFGDGVRRLAAVREAVGPGARIMLDLHGMLLPAEAVAFAERCEPYRPDWIEEPVAPEDLDGAAFVRQRTRIAIALGERLFAPLAFGDAFARGACTVAQPDPLHVGGLRAFGQIAALAGAAHVRVAPHNSNGPVALAACAHLAAALPEVDIVEYTLDLGTPLRNELVDYPFVAEGGALRTPSRPGLGLRLNAALVDQFRAGAVGSP